MIKPVALFFRIGWLSMRVVGRVTGPPLTIR